LDGANGREKAMNPGEEQDIKVGETTRRKWKWKEKPRTKGQEKVKHRRTQHQGKENSKEKKREQLTE
jgi:hypothetical protein